MANMIRPPSDEGVIHAAPDTIACTKEVGRWVLVATILGSSMVMIDGTAINVALPVLQRSLNATVANVQWIVETYALFLAALILVGGSLGDLFGRKRIFAIGIALFALASVGCGLSQNIIQLILARGIQGVGGALLVPGSLSIISTTFSREQRGQAIGTWSGFSVITASLGPVLGGWLVQNISWRWIFFLNIPLAMVVLCVLFWRVPESRDEDSPRKLDGWGALLSILGLGGIVYGLIEASSGGLGQPLVLGSFAFGVLALALFLVVEAHSQVPLMPLSLFRSRTFSWANVFTFLLYGAMGGVMFFFPFNLIQVQGYSATEAGAALLPLILIVFLLSRWSGGLVHRIGAKVPLVVGPLIASVGFLLLAIPAVGGSYWTTFFPAMVVLGIGMATSSIPLTQTVMGAVASEHTGTASGINNAVSRTAALLAVATLSIVVVSAFALSLDGHLHTLGIAPEMRNQLIAQQSKLVGIQIPAGVSSQLRAALRQAVIDSYVSGFRAVMLVGVALAIASSLIALFVIKIPRVAEPKPVVANEGPKQSGAVPLD